MCVYVSSESASASTHYGVLYQGTYLTDTYSSSTDLSSGSVLIVGSRVDGNYPSRLIKSVSLFKQAYYASSSPYSMADLINGNQE